MLTESARRARELRGAHTFGWLRRNGWTDDAIRAQFDALRWRRYGRVVLPHAGPPTPDELRAIALLNCGPRAALTAFAAAHVFGLRGWEREPTDVIVPCGTRVRRVAIAPLQLHYTGDWTGSISSRDGACSDVHLHWSAPPRHFEGRARRAGSSRPGCSRGW